MKAPRKSSKTCPKLIKTLKRHDRNCCGIFVVKISTGPIHNAMLLVYLEQTDVCRVDI